MSASTQKNFICITHRNNTKVGHFQLPRTVLHSSAYMMSRLIIEYFCPASSPKELKTFRMDISLRSAEKKSRHRGENPGKGLLGYQGMTFSGVGVAARTSDVPKKEAVQVRPESYRLIKWCERHSKVLLSGLKLQLTIGSHRLLTSHRQSQR